jgi:hypothetical protein
MPRAGIGMNPQVATGRDLRLDFFRGLALIFIFVDHIPRNYFAWFTSHHYGFSDAAEAFVFISGYSAAMVYSAVAQRSGMLFAGVQIWRRMWQLYIAHVLLFIVFVAQIAWVSGKFNNAMYVEEMNIVGFLDEPHVAVGQALLLKFKPTNLDILPLYILLLMFFPLILFLMRISRWLALGVSALLYAVTLAFDLSLPAYPIGSEWYFNPLAWQFLFTLGAVLGFTPRRDRPRVPRSRVLFWAAIAYIVFAFAFMVEWLIPGLQDYYPEAINYLIFPIDKTDLSLWRLVHFLALAYVVAVLLPPDHWLFRLKAARPILWCGQNSLYVFCLGIFLSFIGHVVIIEVGGRFWAQAAVNAAGIGLMIGLAALLNWYRRTERRGRQMVAARGLSGASAE